MNLTGKRILTIDDSATTRMYLSKMLERYGATVEPAATGQEGVEKCLGMRFDLVLLDLLLPDLHGTEVLSMARTYDQITPIVMLSGEGRIHAVLDALGQGADGYIEKSDLTAIDTVGFLYSLERAIERRAAIVEQKRLQAELAEKNTEILDSITYASRIVRAILPGEEQMKLLLRDYFVFFKPRNILSGDFYWVHDSGSAVVFAVADCTGHGVPGAMMSVIGHTLLNQIVIEEHTSEPSLILEKLHVGIRKALKQGEESADTQDGMDIAIVRIDFRENGVIFAGAKRPLYCVSPTGALTEIPGDRKAIGGRQIEKTRTYTSHRIPIEAGLTIYLATDGFSDQPGASVRKYGSRRFKQFLTELRGKSLAEQKEAFARELAAHQRDEEQRDDILVAAVRL
jgi:serine phosphatase RsbU (regulator of sigma subunit)